MPSIEHHRQHRVGWLRAAVLGANDGIVSTASLVIGVAAAGSTHQAVLIAGLAGLLAGAISMAAGEYVSVCAQQDTEKSDLQLEQHALEVHYEQEVDELAQIYRQRGVASELSETVARQLMAHDALGAHARDEIGISDMTQAQPFVAAFSSALSFTVGAALPIVLVWLIDVESIVYMVSGFSLVFLASLGAMSAYLSGAPLYIGVLRVTIWGAVAMAATALLGNIFDTTVI